MKSKYLLIVLTSVLLLFGCTTSKLTTRIGIQVGKGFLASRDLGVPELKKLVKAWPYVAGQIKAIPHYKEEVPGAAQNVISELDKLAKKTDDNITDSDCGTVATNFVLIEYYAVQFGWDKYGVTITKWAKAALGIGG
jgi:hypothetical protein